ncbi:MAG: family glycosyltransferase, 4-amino-4-deoxy-L-arabinose transferase [Flavipsychrobacter sp.]|jgi:4-amino-4-deoxy-L-arabinose transferase-like glycosyltransferase|nr:family glycosyltransferase, 4-amino-4-deoxy-L-arabinose transferase [Flavipsychrobacter sp.]
MPKVPFWVFVLIALLHLSAIRVDIMDIDASQYAEISREMEQSGSYLQVYDRGADYLDKPPFLFWVSALSMSVFGASNLGYKLPSILFALWAIYATYRLARLLYNENIARMAALILGTCQGMFLMTNDVRTDTILMSCVITAIWMIKETELHRRWYYVLGGTASIACGMMTKGPIALLVPLFCFGSDWVLKRDWKQLFSPYHLLDALLIAIFLVPMSIGLYQQFDMHPEKTVNGLTGVSGLRFFYWSQSFGRITGESPWNNGAGFDFLMSNMLWSFLPWIILFITALVVNVMQLIKQNLRLYPHQEWITMGGFLLAYIALGSSRYQLPHYIFVVFPLAAIITATFIGRLFEDTRCYRLYRIFKPTQVVISLLILVAALLTIVVVFPGEALLVVLWVIAFAVWLIIVLNKKIKGKLFWAPVSAIVLANIFMTHHFYYKLMEYQLGSQVGKYIRSNNIPPEQVLAYKCDDPLNAAHFYSSGVLKREDDLNMLKGHLLTGDDGMKDLKARPHTIAKKGVYFKVSELTPDFLNPATRHKAVKNYYLVKLQ